jgi:phenylacetate-coenzyme A ligase PaaK-like adenylate-forming protein
MDGDETACLIRIKPRAPWKTRLERMGWEPFAALAWWRWGSAAWDVWLGGAAGAGAVEALAARRLRELVRFARSRSPYYAELYRSLPGGDVELRRLPPTTRRALTARFDEWVTDREVRRASVEAFTADLSQVGRPYLGRYAAWTSSGTSGEPGLFVHDGEALAVYDALEAVRLGQRFPLAPAGMRTTSAWERYALVAATGGHFTAVATMERLRAVCPPLAANARVFAILDPLPELVAALNAYGPALVATYPTAARVLALEKSGGRLGIEPEAFLLAGETLSGAVRAAVRDAFQCEVLESYGASEAPSIACECGEGTLHLNADWVILEPVDERYRPVPPGEPSYTALLTNLANRVQPIIRYDLGDSVTFLAERCACGSALPALRVDGRSDEILAFRDPRGRGVVVLPLALTSVVEECDGAHSFQVIQTAADAVSIRLGTDSAEPAGAARARRVQAALRGYFDALGLANVSVAPDPAPPERERRSGKLRRIVARTALKPA